MGGVGKEIDWLDAKETIPFHHDFQVSGQGTGITRDIDNSCPPLAHTAKPAMHAPPALGRPFRAHNWKRVGSPPTQAAGLG